VRHPRKAKPTTKKLRAKDQPLANVFVSEAEFDRLLHAWFGNLARALEPGRAPERGWGSSQGKGAAAGVVGPAWPCSN